MKKHFLFATLFLCLFALISLGSCENDETSQAPVITLERPSDGNEFANGEEVHIEFNVAGGELHELKIELLNKATGAVLFSETPTVHDMTSYDFHDHFEVSGITEHTEVKLNVEASNHTGDVSTKAVTLHFNP